jgi:hypothetical protein
MALLQLNASTRPLACEEGKITDEGEETESTWMEK